MMPAPGADPQVGASFDVREDWESLVSLGGIGVLTKYITRRVTIPATQATEPTP